MGDFIKTQNSFAHGEVAPTFFARDDINGLARMLNMDVIAGGGLRRRRGLRHVTYLRGAGRLISFSAGENDDYILSLTDGHLVMYATDGTRVADILSPWDASALARIQYAQRFGTMIFVHPDFQPYTLSRVNGIFTLTPFDFARNDSDMSVNMPFMKFDDAGDVKITVSKSSQGDNYATLTANRDFWTPENVGGRLQLLGKQWVVTTYTNARTITATTNGGFSVPTAAVSDWQEATFSTRRGWPCSISFHQDRLVFGGSPSWPSGVWMSQVGRHHNFNVGTGLDDEAIFLTLLSARRQQICTVVSSDNLQILTTDGEWAISSKPLTPSVVDIKQHTDVGSMASRYLPPQKIEGQTVFISGSGKDIRELSLDELGEKYNANDLCALSKHLMVSPVDVAYNEDARQLFVVMENGDMAVLNQNSALGISAWGLYQTAGLFQSVAVCGGETFVAVRRNSNIALEKFSDDALMDAGDYPFSYSAAAMPLRAGGHNASRMRVRKITARVLDSKSVFINGIRATMPNEVYNTNHPGYTGDISITQFGTVSNTPASPWVISGMDAMPVTILSVTVHGRYTV